MAITRFAPSPTGRLHIGHAYSALFAEKAARDSGGKFLLRIEDIDPVRCKPEFVEGIIEDLKWLGLSWEEPMRFQSDHMYDYKAALSRLKDLGVVYPCFCTRKEILSEVENAGHAPHIGPDGYLYPGTCQNLTKNQIDDLMASDKPFSWRLDMEKALAITGPLEWEDSRAGGVEANPGIFGDIVIARKDIPTSYHLSVTVDDNLQGISLVTRGEDLFQATSIHRLLQSLLGYSTPRYCHHKLLLDGQGKRFAKRDLGITLETLRASGKSAEDVKGAIGF